MQIVLGIMAIQVMEPRKKCTGVGDPKLGKYTLFSAAKSTVPNYVARPVSRLKTSGLEINM